MKKVYPDAKAALAGVLKGTGMADYGRRLRPCAAISRGRLIQRHSGIPG